MKVVLFCGGFGMRLREYSESTPKPMVTIGYRPMLWHLMKYYAHFGHTDFILCLGWKADVIKQYFLSYDECVSNDFTLSRGGDRVEVFKKDIEDWNITFVDTGVTANIGQRLKAVEEHVAGDEMFLANYTDGLSDLPLPQHLETFRAQRAVGSFVSVRPSQTFHTVSATSDGLVRGLTPIESSGVWVNGGFFIFRREVFDELGDGDDLVGDLFPRLVEEQRLATLRYEGFWACLDTFKEKQLFDEMNARGNSPWQVWSRSGRRASERADWTADDPAPQTRPSAGAPIRPVLAPTRSRGGAWGGRSSGLVAVPAPWASRPW